MAQYTNHFTVSFDKFLAYIKESVLNGSASASMEGGTNFTCGDVRCVTRVFERYSFWGDNRLSLTVTLFGRDGDIQLSAITAGGSRAMFVKTNTWGEESFLDQFVKQVEKYRE